MDKRELLDKLMELSKKGVTLSDLCEDLKLNEYEILALVNELSNEGITISTKKYDDDIYLFNQGEVSDINETYIHKFNTNESNEFKFVAISDTRIGSTSQQLTILNDIYEKAAEMGYSTVIHCGNLTEGIYPVTNSYANTMFLDDSLRQVDYIVNNYPCVDGITTYFILGKKDEKHMKKNKINIGRRVSDMRKDMIYLGDQSATINIDKVRLAILNNKLSKTYTVSYRAQQQVDSYRSEDKPDILLYGGMLQMEKFTYRNVNCISVPSVVATTKEMGEKRYSNTVGAWYLTVETDSRGQFKSIIGMDSVYYSTKKDDYRSAKVLKIGGVNNGRK